MINRNVVFYDKITSPNSGVSSTITVSPNEKTLKLEIFGTSTSRTIQFYEINSNGDLIPLNGFNTVLNTLEVSTSSVSPLRYVFDIEGLIEIRVVVSSVSGGWVSVQGKVII